MRRFCIYIVVTFICDIGFAQRYPTYFDNKSYWYNICDYIVKGEIMDIKCVAEVATSHISAVRIKINDSYGAVLPDTIWIYPDIENYYNGQGKVQRQKRDSLIILTQKEINFDSSTYINFDNIFLRGSVNYYRFRNYDGQYIYSLGDIYFQVAEDDNRVFVIMSKFQRFFKLFKPQSHKESVLSTRFERRINKAIDKL